MSSDRRKNHGRGQRKPEGTSSAIFGVGTPAKCCELKRCADRVRSRTDNKDEVLEGKIRNLNFSPSTKKTTEYSCELFFPFRDIWYSFSSSKHPFCRTEPFLLNKLSFFKSDGCHAISHQENAGHPKAPLDFPPRKDAWHSPPSVGLSWDSPPPRPESVRAYRRTLTSQSNFLASIGYQICFAMASLARYARSAISIQLISFISSCFELRDKLLTMTSPLNAVKNKQ